MIICKFYLSFIKKSKFSNIFKKMFFQTVVFFFDLRSLEACPGTKNKWDPANCLIFWMFDFQCFFILVVFLCSRKLLLCFVTYACWVASPTLSLSMCIDCIESLMGMPMASPPPTLSRAGTARTFFFSIFNFNKINIKNMYLGYLGLFWDSKMIENVTKMIWTI